MGDAAVTATAKRRPHSLFQALTAIGRYASPSAVSSSCVLAWSPTAACSRCSVLSDGETAGRCQTPTGTPTSTPSALTERSTLCLSVRCPQVVELLLLCDCEGAEMESCCCACTCTTRGRFLVPTPSNSTPVPPQFCSVPIPPGFSCVPSLDGTPLTRGCPGWQSWPCRWAAGSCASSPRGQSAGHQSGPDTHRLICIS